ncbi:hypothetical protein D6855_12040 [Butyrivibrio sp. CB08]|uniref:hypothetical protein n=1 Tax=Butyrivibrio sp. CB08 TaxID=2364879 RepID=UPI000EA871E2|nr:hypothetical protein [Butyrivibrio sp. CB08]RKM58881.1 hypothetical protein D6855_12040 [Butyrivibrio sp. CB08]
MTRKKILIPILIAAMALAFTACGPSDEKLAEAETARNLLVEAKTGAEETYLNITDESQKSALDELSEKEAQIEAMDFSKMNDKKIDEILPGINELTEKYQGIQGNLSDTLKTETEVKVEKEKHTELTVYFVNKTGLNLSKIVLHDLTQDSYSDNFIGDGVLLGDGYTLMGAALDIYADSSSWEFIVADEAGTDHILTCDSLKGISKENTPVELTYDPATGEGSAVLSH